MSIFIPGHPSLCCTTCLGPAGAAGATGSTGIKGVHGRLGATGATGLQIHRINRRAVRQDGCPGKTMSNDSIVIVGEIGPLLTMNVIVAIKDKA